MDKKILKDYGLTIYENLVEKGLIDVTYTRPENVQNLIVDILSKPPKMSYEVKLRDNKVCTFDAHSESSAIKYVQEKFSTQDVIIWGRIPNVK